MVQIITRRVSPLYAPPYRGSGELWGWKRPENPIKGKNGEFWGTGKTAILWSDEKQPAMTTNHGREPQGP